MKKFFLLFAVLCCTMLAKANDPLPTDEIWYTSTDGQVANLNQYSTDPFGATRQDAKSDNILFFFRKN